MDHVLSALERLRCAEMTYGEWIRVGMALKEEGYDLGVWEDWSSRDAARYHPGECARHWRSFRGSDPPVTGATIVKMARDRGASPFPGDGCLDWNDEIGGDGPGGGDAPGRTPAEELALYLQTLFDPGDRVGYVTGDAWQNADGKWVPARGVYDRTAGELIASLRQYPDDPAYTVGDWKPEAGAWIRINALDGKGVGNENVTSFRYALVESDEMPADAQIAAYRELELPVAALVHSGNKSVHAVVRVDAADAREYRERVDFLYGVLAARGVKADTQNRNPSRLSRMPGVTRNGRRQALLGVNLGRKSWAEWAEFARELQDDLPGVVPLSALAAAPPALPQELIGGILRRGHKMLISGSSKAGKSFLLMELCAAIAEGGKWLGFRCLKGRVLYINLEIDPASCVSRFLQIYKALGLENRHMEDILIWNLRGHAAPLDVLVPKLIRRARDQALDAIVIDPLYKVITGDENSASDMAAFCNQFDRICSETGCATIYCHHHPKGAQGARRAIDRAAGSGVFTRDPDAHLDMIELEVPEETRDPAAPGGASAWRLEGCLREFPAFRPVDFWFEYPVHRPDTEGALSSAPSLGAADKAKSRFGKTADDSGREFRNAFAAVDFDGRGPKVEDIASYLGLSERTIRDRIKKMACEFTLDRGRVLRAGPGSGF